MHEFLPLEMLDPQLLGLCDAILGHAQVPGAVVAVVAEGRGYLHCHGVKSQATLEPVRPSTGFNIGSCSKAFASATLAALIGEGLADWDDPVTKWVPEFALCDPALTAQVTLRDLSGNRLGLARQGLPEYGMTPRLNPEEVIARLRHTPMAYPLRSRFTYVNAGHTACAVAAGRIGGKGFIPTLRERILTPLGMTTTSGGSATPHDLNDLAGWHVVRDGVVHEIAPVFTDMYLASGGMVVSGHDALQWLRLHLGQGTVDGVEIIAGEALAETHRPQIVAIPGRDIPSLFHPEAHMGAYALGWAVADLRGEPMVTHSGSDLGVCAQTTFFPRAGIGIAVYNNAFGGGPAPVALSFAMASTLLGLAPRDWFGHFRQFSNHPSTPPEPEPTDQDPAEFIGSYLHPGDGPLDISWDGVQLTGQFRDSDRFTFDLAPTGPDRFALSIAAVELAPLLWPETHFLTFVREADRIVRVEISGFFEGRHFVRLGDG